MVDSSYVSTLLPRPPRVAVIDGECSRVQIISSRGHESSFNFPRNRIGRTIVYILINRAGIFHSISYEIKTKSKLSIPSDDLICGGLDFDLWWNSILIFLKFAWFFLKFLGILRKTTFLQRFFKVNCLFQKNVAIQIQLFIECLLKWKLFIIFSKNERKSWWFFLEKVIVQNLISESSRNQIKIKAYCFFLEDVMNVLNLLSEDKSLG